MNQCALANTSETHRCFRGELKQVKEGEVHEFTPPRYPNEDLGKAVRRWSYEARNRDLKVISAEGIWDRGYVWKTPAAEERWIWGRGVSAGQKTGPEEEVPAKKAKE